MTDLSQDPVLDACLARRLAPSSPCPLSLGAMNFGKRTPEPEAKRIVSLAVDLGILLIDTANAYQEGESERIVGRALRELDSSSRGKVRVATKVGLSRKSGHLEGLSKERVLAACDESLGRLSRDRIDLYYLHSPDDSVPIEHTLEALAQLFQQGKIRAWGMSNYASWQILDASQKASAFGIGPPRVAQMLYNVLIRQLEIEYLKFADRQGLSTTVYNPLAGGLLTGSYALGQPVRAGSRFDGNAFYQSRYFSQRFLEQADVYQGIAAREGLSLLELSYAWLASRKGVDSILVGPGTVDHLQAAHDAVRKTFSREAERALRAAYVDYLGTTVTYAR